MRSSLSQRVGKSAPLRPDHSAHVRSSPHVQQSEVCLYIKLHTSEAVSCYVREAYLSIQETVKDGDHEALKTPEDVNMRHS